MQVALTDITARKKAEAYLEFLGKHDVLTKLYNRSFYVDEFNRLERKGPSPLTIIMADLNGLKEANDQLGHSAGDELLAPGRRGPGEASAGPPRGPHRRRRIRHPAAGHRQREAVAMIEDIERLTELNNQFYSGTVQFLMGRATREPASGSRIGRSARIQDVRGEARLSCEIARLNWHSQPTVSRSKAKSSNHRGPRRRNLR